MRVYAIMLVAALAAVNQCPAFALSVGVAAKCDARTTKAYPHRVVGNPAAGLLHGSAAQARKYYNKCVTEAEQRNRHHSETVGQPPAK